MQFPGQGKPPLGVIFDSAMGERIDSALALALLYALDGRNEARVISVSVSKPNLKSAAFVDVLGRFYAGAASGPFSRNLPVGMALEGKLAENTPMLTAPLSKKGADGKPVYQHDIEKLNDTAEVPALIRNAFTSQPDQNCAVVLAGPASNLAQVLGLPGVKDLIASKVRYLVVAGGAYPNGQPELYMKTDIAAARRLFAEWPTPVYAVGEELGEALRYPASSIENDFSWSPNHPVVDAYRAYHPMPYDAPTGAMAAALYAVRPKETYFQLSGPGVISVLDDGRTKFTPSADGKHRYLSLDPAQKDAALKAFTELASAKPAERKRIRQQKKQETPPPKPAEAKPQTPVN